MKPEEMPEVLNIWLNDRFDRIHTVMPGKFLSYKGHGERKAKVQPMLKIRTVHDKLISIDPIDDVQVMFQSTSSFNMLFPIAKDDGCLLLFSEGSIGDYMNSDMSQLTEPEIKTRFSLSNCIAIPGFWSTSKIPDAPDNSNDFWLTFQDSKIRIKDKTNEILIEDKLGNKIETTQTGLSIVDKNSNNIEMGLVSVKINDNFEVLQ